MGAGGRLPRDARLPAIAATDWGGVFLESGRERTVLCVLPQTDPEAIDRVPRERGVGALVEAMIVVNDRSLGGALWGTEVQERLGIDRAAVYATEPGAPLDRPAGGRAAGRGSALPRKLRRGPLTLRRRAGAPVLEARWRLGELEVRALVGAAIPFSEIVGPVRPHFVVGSLTLSGEEPPQAEALRALEELTLVAGAPPDTAAAMERFWTALGVPVKVVGAAPRVDDGALELAEALRAGDDQRVRAALAGLAPDEVEATIVSLSARGDLADARRLATLALEAGGAPARLWYQRGIVELMAGDRSEAERCWRAALEAGEPHEEAASALSSLQAAPAAHRFPRHAALMIETGRALAGEGRLEEALGPLRRAVELDPSSLAAAADLGRILSELGRDEAALAVYDDVLGRALAGELIRYNRGNALTRLRRLDEAAAEYRRCCELVPDWIEPRANLALVLHALGRADEARAEANELERRGADPQLVAAIREQLEQG